MPRISDPLANQWTKGVARVVKYLQDLDASGRDVRGPGGRRDRGPTRPPPGQPGGQAGRSWPRRPGPGKVSDEDYVRYLWHKVHARRPPHAPRVRVPCTSGPGRRSSRGSPEVGRRLARRLEPVGGDVPGVLDVIEPEARDLLARGLAVAVGDRRGVAAVGRVLDQRQARGSHRPG